MIPEPRRRASRAALIAVLVLAVLAFGIAAVLRGQSSNWDLRNYHLYDGWAFWTGRGDLDFAAAQMQTYFNPLLATATYLLFMHTAPWLSALLLGMVQGSNLLPLYLLSRRLLPDRSVWIALLLALVGATGVTQRGELGTSFGDTLVSLPILCAWVLALTGETSLRRGVCAGLLVGAATGLKLTMAPCALGLLVAWPLLHAPSRWRALIAIGAATGFGFLLTDGFWLWHLWSEFHDPLFPMLGNRLGGDFAPAHSMRDLRWPPRGAIEWLFYPVVWGFNPRRVSELWFLDLRLPLLFLSVPLLLQRATADVDAHLPRRSLGIAMGVAYLAWLCVFGYYRYLVVLEMLAPLALFLLLTRIPRIGVALAPALVVLCGVVTRAPDWEHVDHYEPEFLRVEISPMPDLRQAIVIFADTAALSYLALGLPDGVRYVRIKAGLLGDPLPENGLDREARRRIAAASGPLYLLVADPDAAALPGVLARHRLRRDGDCTPVRSNLQVPSRDPAWLCPARHETPP